MTFSQWLVVFFVGGAVILSFLWMARDHYRLRLKSEHERYDGLMQRTLLLQQDRDRDQEELRYLKVLFQHSMSRPLNAYMTDSQVMQLGQALVSLVQGHVKANPSGMN